MTHSGHERGSRKGCIQCSREFTSDLSLCPHDGTRLTTLGDSDLVGTVLADRYEILEVIGGGGMGLVYKARQRLMNRIVAIKMLHKHMISSAEALKRFQLEAQAASRLSLPNILTIYDFELTPEGQPYMVMDYLEGASLADVLEDEDHLPVQRSLNIFAQVCAGLWHAHQKGIIHRDLKPSNIMLVTFGDQSDFVKIVDFGIAKLLRSNDQQAAEQLTRTGEVFGSPLYMSPEQCKGKVLDHRSDIYSLGSVMYRTLTGHPLFSGEEVVEFLFKQVSESPLPFAEIAPNLTVPKQVEEVVFKALEKDPDKRWQSMSELKDALEFLKNQLAKEGKQETVTTPRQNSNAHSSVPPPEVQQSADNFVTADRHPQVQKMDVPEYAQSNYSSNPNSMPVAAKPSTGLEAELGTTGRAPALVNGNPQNPQPGFPIAAQAAPAAKPVQTAQPAYQRNLQTIAATSTNSSLPTLKPLTRGAVPRPGNIPILKAGYQNLPDANQASVNATDAPPASGQAPQFSEPTNAALQSAPSFPSSPPSFSNVPPMQIAPVAAGNVPGNVSPPESASPFTQPVGIPPGLQTAPAPAGVPANQAVRLDRIPQDAAAPQPHLQPPMAPLDRIFSLPPQQAGAARVQNQNPGGQNGAPPAPSRPNLESPQIPGTPIDPRAQAMPATSAMPAAPAIASAPPMSAAPPTMDRPPFVSAQQQRTSKPDYQIVPENPRLLDTKSEPLEIPRRAGFESGTGIGPTGTQALSHLPDAPAKPVRSSRRPKSNSSFDSQRYSHLSDSSPGLFQNKRLFFGIGFGVLIIFGLTFAVQEFSQREETKTSQGTSSKTTPGTAVNVKATAMGTQSGLVPPARLPGKTIPSVLPANNANVSSRTEGHQDVSKLKVATESPENVVHTAVVPKKHHHVSRPAYQTSHVAAPSTPESQVPVKRHAYSTYGY